MKNTIRFISLILSAVIFITAFSFTVSADENVQSGTFSFANYNVAGLPSLSPSSDKAAKQKLLGSTLYIKNYDIIAVQEDFGYDSDLYKGLQSEYRTYGHQNVVTGDGLNIFSSKPLYNVHRETWNKKGGMIWEGDIVSQKGFMYAAVEIGDGVFIDVYNLHADAFGGNESIKARHSNFTQVMEYIKAHSEGRAVIITGDFNTCFHFSNGEGDDLYDIFINELGMSDVWTELKNDGSFSEYSQYSGSYWGNWDSVEYILYRSSENITLTPLSHDYINFADDKGVPFSDHSAAVSVFSYSASEKSDGYALMPARKMFPSLINTVKVVAEDLRYVFSHFDEVVIMLKYANDTEVLYENYVI